MIENYLPAQLSDDQIDSLIDEVLSEQGLENLSAQDMGRVIGAVKAKAGASADGSAVARLTKARIES